jgi:hypothetical protein
MASVHTFEEVEQAIKDGKNEDFKALLPDITHINGCVPFYFSWH